MSLRPNISSTAVKVHHNSLFNLCFSSDVALASGIGRPCSQIGSLDFMAEGPMYVLVSHLITEDSLA